MGNKASRPTSASEPALEALLSRHSALQRDMFALHTTAHHGVPSNTKALAFCGSQGILAVGTASGAVKFYGGDGLEILFEGPESVSHLTVGVTHLQFTASQRLVVGYTDSSLRVFDLASRTILSYVSDAWTTSTITCLETLKYTPFPYFFVATDDGDVHVVHEETGQVSTYVIRSQDLSVLHAEGVTAMAAHPSDANLLLLAYDTCPAVLLWNVAKRKVVREFTLSVKTHKTVACRQSEKDEVACNSPQCLSWHSSGKRFAAGYKDGGFAVFRVEKTQGLYRQVAASAPRDTSLKHIKWLCAPPTSQHAALPGAIVFSRASDSTGLTLIYPPPDGRSSDDILTELYKADTLMWLAASIESVNHAPVTAFEAAIDHVDNSAKAAPLSLILLSGNPLDGCLPTISVQFLPCFVKLGEGDKAEWEWRMYRLPEAAIIPPQVQLSPLTTFALVTLPHSDDTFRTDLIATFDPAKYSPMFCMGTSGEFEWPINGGSKLDALRNTSFATSGTDTELNSMLLLTGHANGCVQFWEAQVALDRSSKGAIRLLHVVDAPLLRSCAPVNTEITCLTFCPVSRTLVLGFASGEVVVLDFKMCNSSQTGPPTDAPKEQNLSPQMQQNDVMGFHPRFSLHIYTEPVAKLVLSSVYGYVAVAYAAGMTSLIEMKTRQFQVLTSDLSPSSEESMIVDSLLMSELMQTTDIPGKMTASGPQSNRTSGKASLGKASNYSDDTTHSNMIQHREVILVLFVGHGNGKLEMFHVQSATQMGETLLDPAKATSVASLLMIDEQGKRIEILGRDGNTVGGSELVIPLDKGKFEITEESRKDNAREHAVMQPLDADFGLTQQLLTEGIGERLYADGQSKSPSHLVFVTVPPGSLGLHLCMEVEQHAVVKEFAKDSGNAALLREHGVCIGHTLTAINGVDLSLFNRDAICSVLEKLRERERRLIFAPNFSEIDNIVKLETVNSSPGGLESVKSIDEPRFLLCACGRILYLIQATVPQAAEMARGPKDCPAKPLASIELQGHVVVMSVVRVPVRDTIENCLAVVDHSNRVYMLSLPSLRIVWDTECSNLISRSLVEISIGGELVVANTFGEMERFSLFAEAVTMKSALLERNTIETSLYRPERVLVCSQATTTTATVSGGKKRSMAADAGTRLKKLVLSVTQEATDLNKVFSFSTEADERKQLLGDRSPVVKDATGEGLNATKDSLMQAQQRLAERGEKLNDLGLKTEQMKKTSKEFYQTMKAFNEKNASKKWYEF